MNMKDSKTKEPHKFLFNLSQRFVCRSTNKHVAFQNLSVYYTWKNIRKQYKNKKLKIITPTWNDVFELPDGSYSVSDTQENIEFAINKDKTITKISPIHVYINRINNRSVFKINDEYKLELQTSQNNEIIRQHKRNSRQNEKRRKNNKSRSISSGFSPI